MLRLVKNSVCVNETCYAQKYGNKSYIELNIELDSVY